jgi:hypothetical protein
MRRTALLTCLAERQNYRCCYCGHPMVRHQHRNGWPTPRNTMTFDHLEPKSYGGAWLIENMVIACAQCNQLRGNMEALAFFNLQQKWFRRNRLLWYEWHIIPWSALQPLRQQCLLVHERQLYGLARRDLERAFRHFALVRTYPHLLRAC